LDILLELLKYSSIAVSVTLPSFGAIIGMSWSMPAISGAGTEKPESISRNLYSVILAEALAIYGVIVGLLLIFKMDSITTFPSAISALSAGLTVGLATLAAGFGIGVCGRSVATASARRPEVTTKLLLGVILSEAIGIYGLIAALLLVFRI